MSRSHDIEIRRIGRQVRLLREQAGQTMVQLADAAGISERALRALEAGQTNPSLTTVVRVAEGLGVPLDEIVSAALRHVPNVDYTPAAVSADKSAELTRDLPNPRMRARIVRLDETDSDAVPASAVFGHVLTGSVKVSLDGNAPTLKSHDSFHAQAGVLAGWQGAGGRLLIVEAMRGQDLPPLEDE